MAHIFGCDWKPRYGITCYFAAIHLRTGAGVAVASQRPGPIGQGEETDADDRGQIYQRGDLLRAQELVKNMPMELMMKSTRYCMRALMYWASMMKYRRTYSVMDRTSASADSQNLDGLVVKKPRQDEGHGHPTKLYRQHGQEYAPSRTKCRPRL